MFPGLLGCSTFSPLSLPLSLYVCNVIQMHEHCENVELLSICIHVQMYDFCVLAWIGSLAVMIMAAFLLFFPKTCYPICSVLVYWHSFQIIYE
jgi:hypothetical protein